MRQDVHGDGEGEETEKRRNRVIGDAVIVVRISPLLDQYLWTRLQSLTMHTTTWMMDWLTGGEGLPPYNMEEGQADSWTNPEYHSLLAKASLCTALHLLYLRIAHYDGFMPTRPTTTHTHQPPISKETESKQQTFSSQYWHQLTTSK